jgi:hypothetical protein
MEKRQGVLVAFVGVVILAAGAFWWFTQDSGETTAETPVVQAPPKPVAPAAAPAPVIVKPAESDAVALSEEDVDKAQAEKDELASRASDLESQVNDGKALIALKEKQIKELEAQLKQSQAGEKKK